MRETEDTFAFVSEGEIYIRLLCQYKHSSSQQRGVRKAWYCSVYPKHSYVDNAFHCQTVPGAKEIKWMTAVF